jgi:quercetin dioxygenase-like cupin family protein
MFNKKKKSSAISAGSKSLLSEQLLNLKVAQEALLYKIQTKKVYRADTPGDERLDFIKNSSVYYMSNIKLTDLTTDEQLAFGVSIMRAEVEDTTDMPLHEHNTRYQMIYINAGSIIDNETEKEYMAGEAIYIGKNTKHALRYTKHSDVLLISIPGLSVIENIE